MAIWGAIGICGTIGMDGIDMETVPGGSLKTFGFNGLGAGL